MNLKLLKLGESALDVLKRLVPDINKRKELEVAIITLMHNLRSKWIINVLTLWIISLYTSYKFELVKSFETLDFTILVVFLSFHIGISPEAFLNVYNKISKWYKKKKR